VPERWVIFVPSPIIADLLMSPRWETRPVASFRSVRSSPTLIDASPIKAAATGTGYKPSRLLVALSATACVVIVPWRKQLRRALAANRRAACRRRWKQMRAGGSGSSRSGQSRRAPRTSDLRRPVRDGDCLQRVGSSSSRLLDAAVESRWRPVHRTQLANDRGGRTQTSRRLRRSAGPSKWTGRSTGKAPPTPLGRERQLATFGCSRSPAILSPSVVTHERSRSPTSDLLDEVGERPFPKWTGRPMDAFGSPAPVRDFRMQPFVRDFVPIGGCHRRTTAVAEL
jgi:hypothetical protein